MIMQQAPNKNRAPGEPPICSTGRGGVALDVVMAAALGAGALVALANDEPGVGLGFGAIGGIYGYSAVSGHRSANACEAALEDHQLEITARRTPPRERRPGTPASEGPVLARPVGPRLEEAAPDEAPPDEEDVVDPEPASPPAAAAAPPPAAAPSPRDWSDFWVEVRR